MKNKIYENHLKEIMRERPVFGVTIYSGCPQFIELLGYAGFDFAFIDAEHCPWETTGLHEAVLAARSVGISPLVRVTSPDMIEIRKALEMGAEGVIVPHVRTVEEMEICVKGAKFPPIGRRGFDVNVRAAQYGFDLGGVEFYEEANRTELVIPMAEDFEFTDQLDEMMSVQGIDAINFGPADFSMSLNCKSNTSGENSFYDLNDSPADVAMKEIIAKARSKEIGVMAPAVPPTYENAKKLIDKGVNMVIMGNDLGNYAAALKTIRDETLAKFK
ncbi:2,4-dihydroxyhept-2-ene-1,7-dioic acid aldolase [Schaedlerella arabinosiphila]|uniref:2,4-dihydroxyhept-2-ene-1,7-dioic acid aldolase n=1 Tax=Schaedlerella arabinosiphila TaxID=2044587 RepID=A0A3R8JRF6_9FIRM|nr:aldolase/citrate lyase family protein [Schaedlerella arabinosiphila]RRK33984.1 2,4-dihydroxyhept-2-ene-1,7-dioic acid aldolase [Schaedlerella arabinosiphila]